MIVEVDIPFTKPCCYGEIKLQTDGHIRLYKTILKTLEKFYIIDMGL